MILWPHSAGILLSCVVQRTWPTEYGPVNMVPTPHVTRFTAQHVEMTHSAFVITGSALPLLPTTWFYSPLYRIFLLLPRAADSYHHMTILPANQLVRVISHSPAAVSNT